MPDGFNGKEVYEMLGKMKPEERENYVCFSWWSTEDVDRMIEEWKEAHPKSKKGAERLDDIDKGALLDWVLSDAYEDASVGDINYAIWDAVCQIAEGKKVRGNTSDYKD